MAKILIADDDPIFSDTVVTWLKSEKFEVELVPNGTEALERLSAYSYDAIILDWQMPGMDGTQVCQAFRKLGGSTPVLMLTGQNTVEKKIAGLDAGADDYLTKPFDMLELLARLRALMRRPADFSGTIVTVGDFSVDTRARVVTRSGAPIKLQPKEFAILEFLIKHPNQVFSAEEILNRVWNDAAGVSAESLYTYIKTLRKKLSAGGACPIRTVHGQGYSFDTTGNS